jgi:hypothetical protein
MDITNNERMRLAASAYRAYIEHAAQMELPLNEDAVDDDILADLIALRRFPGNRLRECRRIRTGRLRSPPRERG